MVATPDTLFMTGPNFVQVLPPAILVTPTGGSQITLADALATASSVAITGTVTPFPIRGVNATQGGAVTVTGGTSSTSANAGGAVTVAGGTPGATGIGGAVSIVGAAGGGGTAAGGNVNLVGGAAASTGQPGEVQVNADSSLIFATYYFTGSPAATDQVFFLATRAMRVKTMSQVHSVAAGGASTLTVIKDTGTSAPGTGTSLHQSGSFNLNATANTVQNGSVTTTIATANLAAGDRLAVKFANAIQSSAGIVVTVGMVPI